MKSGRRRRWAGRKGKVGGEVTVLIVVLARSPGPRSQSNNSRRSMDQFSNRASGCLFRGCCFPCLLCRWSAPSLFPARCERRGRRVTGQGRNPPNCGRTLEAFANFFHYLQYRR